MKRPLAYGTIMPEGLSAETLERLHRKNEGQPLDEGPKCGFCNAFPCMQLSGCRGNAEDPFSKDE